MKQLLLLLALMGPAVAADRVLPRLPPATTTDEPLVFGPPASFPRVTICDGRVTSITLCSGGQGYSSGDGIVIDNRNHRIYLDDDGE
jgi:hypothetical protein